MVKLSELRNAEDVRATHMQDAEYRREYERTRLANDVAIKVIQFRVTNGLSQAELARRLGMRQPNVARLESGDHEPSLRTLARLAEVLNQDFSIEVKPSRLKLRHPARSTTAGPPYHGLSMAGRTGAGKKVGTAGNRGSRLASVAASAKSPKRTADRSSASPGQKTQSPRASSR
jgi:DNA-binding XRE family transcriptional regulator